MKLNYITFMVRNIAASTAFYRELAGLTVVRRISPPAGEIAFLANEAGDTMLELIEFEGVETVQATGMVVSFLAEGELEALREKAVQLGHSPSEIIDAGPKPKHFRILDPDGIVVEFGV